MKIFDFGKNSYSLGTLFKFDCISPSIVTAIVSRLALEKKLFTEIAKDDNTGETVLTMGNGTEQAPLHQLRIDANEVNLWAGWFVAFDSYQKWRNNLLPELALVLRDLHPGMVQAVASQASFGVLEGKTRKPDDVPESAQLLGFYRRFIPESLLKRGKGSFMGGDEDGKRSIELTISPGISPIQLLVTYTVRNHILDTSASLEQNFVNHANFADEMIQALNDRLLSLFIEP